MYIGKPYKEKKIYETDEGLFINRGAAVNSGRSIFVERRLLYTAEQEALLGNKDAEVCRFEDGDNTSSWFLDIVDAMMSPAAKAYAASNPDVDLSDKIRKVPLDRTEVEPVTFPIYARFDYINGRLCARINLHPERDGPFNRGMVCFADRSVPDPAPGIIKVESAVDKGNYAFVSGKMIPYGMVDEERFLDFIWESGVIEKCGDEQVYVVDHPSLGKHLRAEEYVWIETESSFYAEAANTDYQKVPCPLTDDIRKYIIKTTTLQDMLLANSFGEEGVANILSSFTASVKASQLKSETVAESVEHLPSVIKTGIAEGLISQVRVQDIDYLILNKDRLYKLCGFLDNEITAMAAEFSNINKRADDMVKASIR